MQEDFWRLAPYYNLTVMFCVSLLWRGVYVPAGEGYECTVTVDDEDSKVIIFDNWKQVSCTPSSLSPVSVLLLWWPLPLRHILLPWPRHSLHGPHEPKKQFLQLLWFVCIHIVLLSACAMLRRESCRRSCTFWSSLIWKNGNRSLFNLTCVERVSVVNKNILARARICATLHEQSFQFCESWLDPMAMIIEWGKPEWHQAERGNSVSKLHMNDCANQNACTHKWSLITWWEGEHSNY